MDTEAPDSEADWTKRVAIALAAVALAAVAAVGVVRSTGDSDAAPRPGTSQDQRARDQLQQRSEKQAKQLKIAQADLARTTSEFAQRFKKAQATENATTTP